jgi:hypothetical protein
LYGSENAAVWMPSAKAVGASDAVETSVAFTLTE